MLSLTETRKEERALLVGVSHKGRGSDLARDSLNELHELAKTAGVVIKGEELVTVRDISPATYIRSGTIQRIKDLVTQNDITVVLFDEELSPIQNRNLEQEWCKKVVDRTGIILDIFALHAHSKEGKLQVELAQYEYLYPRLVGAWTHLSKQRGGGVGLRGPGETQLEVDRRRARERISMLKKELVLVESARHLHRQSRKALPIPTVTLIGYTNAGKSTLFNSLTQGTQLSVDKLFATLDPKTKKIRLGSGREVLLTDTVGFIRHLPHQLVAAFKSTFEEARHSDLLLHVVDSSRSDKEALMMAVNEVLSEIGLNSIPQIVVFNKSDLCLPDEIYPAGLKEVRIAAINGEGLSQLLERIDDELSANLKKIKVLIPHTDYDKLNMIFEQGRMLSRSNEEAGTLCEAFVSDKLAKKLENFEIE